MQHFAVHPAAVPGASGATLGHSSAEEVGTSLSVDTVCARSRELAHRGNHIEAVRLVDVALTETLTRYSSHSDAFLAGSGGNRLDEESALHVVERDIHDVCRCAAASVHSRLALRPNEAKGGSTTNAAVPSTALVGVANSTTSLLSALYRPGLTVAASVEGFMLGLAKRLAQRCGFDPVVPAPLAYLYAQLAEPSAAVEWLTTRVIEPLTAQEGNNDAATEGSTLDVVPPTQPTKNRARQLQRALLHGGYVTVTTMEKLLVDGVMLLLRTVATRPPPAQSANGSHTGSYDDSTSVVLTPRLLTSLQRLIGRRATVELQSLERVLRQRYTLTQPDDSVEGRKLRMEATATVLARQPTTTSPALTQGGNPEAPKEDKALTRPSQNRGVFLRILTTISGLLRRLVQEFGTVVRQRTPPSTQLFLALAVSVFAIGTALGTVLQGRKPLPASRAQILEL